MKTQISYYWGIFGIILKNFQKGNDLYLNTKLQRSILSQLNLVHILIIYFNTSIILLSTIQSPNNFLNKNWYCNPQSLFSLTCIKQHIKIRF
jgi:hypothetical protein